MDGHVRPRDPLLLCLRVENLAGLSGRVLEVSAGTGTNFALYPDSVTEVVATLNSDFHNLSGFTEAELRGMLENTIYEEGNSISKR